MSSKVSIALTNREHWYLETVGPNSGEDCERCFILNIGPDHKITTEAGETEIVVRQGTALYDELRRLAGITW